MATLPYIQILRMAGIRVNAIPGATATARETNYLTSPLLAANLGSRDFLFSNHKDICVGVIGEIISAYASSKNHPYRTYNVSQTANLAHNSTIPSTSSTGKPIVGDYGPIRDSVDTRICTKQPLQLIQTIVDNQDTFLKSPYYYFDIFGRVIAHTRPNVTIEVCIFSASDELTAIAANGNAPIPDALLMMAVDGMSSKMIVDDEFQNQAQIFNSYYQNGLAMLRNGGTVYTPAPVQASSADPVAS